MKQTIFVLLACALITTVLYSCKKGDTGPAGAQGPAGPQGLAGAQGVPGTANVIYGDWFTPNAYVKDTVFGIWGFNFDKAVPAITQSILDSGAVLVYGKLLGYNPAVWPSTRVSQMPISLTYKQSGKTHEDTWSGYASPGMLRIRFVNDQNEYNAIATQHTFRYIILPGGKKEGARMAQRSYEEICRMYGIQE